MSNNTPNPFSFIDWQKVYANVQLLIAQALREHKLDADNIVGVIPSGSLPGNPIPPIDNGPSEPPAGGYPPVAATATTIGGIVLTNDLGGTALQPQVVGFADIPLLAATLPIPDGAVYAYDAALGKFRLRDVAELVVATGAVSPYHIAYTNAGDIVHRNDGTVVTVKVV